MSDPDRSEHPAIPEEPTRVRRARRSGTPAGGDVEGTAEQFLSGLPTSEGASGTPVSGRRPLSVPERVRSWHPERIVSDLLLEDEKVYEMASPDWWVVTLDQAPLAVAGVLVAMLSASLVGAGPALLLLMLLIAVLAWRALDAWHTRYVLTDFRVLRTSGVLDRNVEFIPWRKVTDVSLKRSFWQRMVGASTIRIESANEASQFRAMTDVRNPKEFFRMLQEVMAAFSGHVEL